MDIESLRGRGDGLADDFVASLIAFDDIEGSAARVSAVLGWFRSIERNEQLLTPLFPDSFDPVLCERLRRFLGEATRVPSFADRESVAIAERSFEERGYLSSLVYLCASLPEVYVVPDISMVLHVTGRLESAAEHRIRSTATMVISVLLKGGLLSKVGVGLALTLRARLIHSVLRVLLLRGHPAEFRDLDEVILKIESEAPPASLFELAYSHGWNVRDSGIPCNQGELLYTMLTFGFVFLRSVKRLGVALTPPHERAFLQTWNLVGYYMGVDASNLPQSYQEAGVLFERFQASAFSNHGRPLEFRRQLGQALLAQLERSLRHKGLRHAARLLTGYLTSRKTVEALGFREKLDVMRCRAFSVLLAALKLCDRVCRHVANVSPIAGVYRYASLAIIENLLLDHQRPLALPLRQIRQVEQVMSAWKSR